MQVPLYEEQILLNVPEPEVRPAERLPHWFNAETYQACLQADADYLDGYPNLDAIGAAYEKTFLFLTALDQAMLPSVSVVINSSTGKDSTLMTALYIAAMRRWKAHGRTLRKVLVQVSDTHCEFPEMALRMRAEVAALNRYGLLEGLPLRANLVSPPPKNRILVELIANGKPLPKIAGGKARHGYEPAAWCMSRVKAGVLDRALKEARKDFPLFVQCLGVRTDESAKRATTIARYTVDELPAVSRLGDDLDRLGFCPVSHWDDASLRAWMIEAQRHPEEECPWRPEGMEELISIYTKGAGEKDNPHECALVITKDGGLSNSCSDLTGTRMGCWCCLISINRSLKNTALHDQRYLWLKRCHELIYAHHARNQARVKLRDSSGFVVETLFPKSFTFEERYRLLVHIFRAEMESGFELLAPEDLQMITEIWGQRMGVFTVTIEDAREDARRWKETGVLEFSYQKNLKFADILARELSEGIPAGAFFPGNENLEPLNLAHLVGLSAGGFGSAFVPTLLSYVFFDRRKTDRMVIMVTDLPSVMGTRTNTGLLSGMLGAAWECVSVRLPTEWEKEVSSGRVFFYATNQQEERKHIQEELKEGIGPFRALDRFYENMRSAHGGCPEDPLAESIALSQDIPKLSREDYARGFVLCGRLAYASDELHYNLRACSRKAVRDAGANPDKLEDPAGREYRAAFKKKLSQDMELDRHREVFSKYAATLREILQLIRIGKLSCGLVQRFCYLARLDAVDPEEACREWDQFLAQQIGLPSALEAVE